MAKGWELKVRAEEGHGGRQSRWLKVRVAEGIIFML